MRAHLPAVRMMLPSARQVAEQLPAARFVIEDRAKQVDPATIRSRDLSEVRPGGLGVYIINEVMDDVTYAMRPEGGMSLTMVKHGQPKDAKTGGT